MTRGALLHFESTKIQTPKHDWSDLHDSKQSHYTKRFKLYPRCDQKPIQYFQKTKKQITEKKKKEESLSDRYICRHRALGGRASPCRRGGRLWLWRRKTAPAPRHRNRNRSLRWPEFSPVPVTPLDRSIGYRSGTFQSPSHFRSDTHHRRRRRSRSMDMYGRDSAPGGARPDPDTGLEGRSSVYSSLAPFPPLCFPGLSGVWVLGLGLRWELGWWKFRFARFLFCADRVHVEVGLWRWRRCALPGEARRAGLCLLHAYRNVQLRGEVPLQSSPWSWISKGFVKLWFGLGLAGITLPFGFVLYVLVMYVVLLLPLISWWFW